MYVLQERLHHAVQSQICGELRTKSFPELCESLDKLDIAISFLKSVGSDPESSLVDFMSNIKIDNPFPSPKVIVLMLVLNWLQKHFYNTFVSKMNRRIFIALATALF